MYDVVIERFDAAGDMPLRKEVARAVFNKGVTLSALGRREAAIAIYDDVVERYGSKASWDCACVAWALFNKQSRSAPLDVSKRQSPLYDEVSFAMSRR